MKLRFFKFSAAAAASLFFILSAFPVYSVPASSAVQTVQSESNNFPSLEPLFTGSETSSELTGEDIIRYALLFSECKEGSAEWNKALSKFRQVENKVKSEPVMSLPEEQRAETILSIMYESTITQYVENQTKMDVLLLKGTYNCVSSSVMFAALARTAGIDFVGVKTPTHAFCTVLIGDKKIDVETTNPYGFNPGRKQVLEQSEKQTKYAVIPKKNYASRHDVSVKTLVSLIGNNLTSAYIKDNDYFKAVPMSLTVYKFRKGEDQWEVQDARESFDTSAMNYSVILGRQKEHVKALEWLNQVRDNYGGSKKINADYSGVLYNAVSSLINSGEFTRASELFEENKLYLPEKDRASMQTAIFVSLTQDKLNQFDKKGDTDGALAYVLSRYSSPEAAEKSAKETLDKWQEYYWLYKINELNKKAAFLEAVQVCNEALKNMPQNAKLKTAKSNALHNHDVTYHNMVAKYVQSREYKAALKVLEKGLQENPESQILKSDIEKIKKAMN